MTINVEPSKDTPVPYSMADEEPKDFAEALAISANTQDLLEQLGGPPEVSPEDAKKTAAVLQQAIKTQDTKALNSPPVAFAAREFLRVYSSRLAVEMNDVRAAITNKLMELANCGDPRYELKALELLGKHSDIALFTERSEVTITYKNSSDLETAIKERVKRLLNADVVDITPIVPEHLDDLLGVATPVETESPDIVNITSDQLEKLEDDQEELLSYRTKEEAKKEAHSENVDGGMNPKKAHRAS